MRHLVLLCAAVVVTSPVAFAPAFGQNAQQPSQGTKKALDPNEVVCERQRDTGSRLSQHRVCKTRAEWAEERRAARMDIDKAQTLRGTDSPQ